MHKNFYAFWLPHFGGWKSRNIPHFGGTSEFFDRKHFPHFGGDILYIAMYVGKIKRFLPLQNGLTTLPKSRSPLRAVSAHEETEASQPDGFI